MTAENLKYTKIAIGSAIVLALGYFVFFKGKDTGGATTDPTGNGNNDNAGPGGVAFNADIIQLTLFDAMNQLGTDDITITQTLRYLTPAQFQLVFKAFGNQKYSDILGYSTSTGTPRNLGYWLKAELSTDDYNFWKRKFSILV